MLALRKRLTKVLLTLITGGIVVGNTGSGADDEVYHTLGLVGRIIDVWV